MHQRRCVDDLAEDSAPICHQNKGSRDAIPMETPHCQKTAESRAEWLRLSFGTPRGWGLLSGINDEVDERASQVTGGALRYWLRVTPNLRPPYTSPPACPASGDGRSATFHPRSAMAGK